MLDRRTWEACLIDCTEYMSNIYENRSQTCCSNGKTYRYAQLGELVCSVAVEHVSEHEVAYGREPAGENRDKVKLRLSGSHLEPQDVRLQRHREDDDLE
jgi:hypothetical protein